MSSTSPARVTPAWTLPDRLVKARHVGGYTQTELARRLSISEKTVKRYEAGEPTKPAVVIAWAYACGVSIEWMLGSPSDSDAITLGYAAMSDDARDRYLVAA